MPTTTCIFVPGITGSYLYDRRLLNWLIAGANVLWPNPLEMVAGGMRKLTILYPGYDVGYDVHFLSPGGAIGPYYSGWWDWLRRRAAVNVVDFNMDWRREWVYDGAEMARCVLRNTDPPGAGARQTFIICHSRGGLVTRWCLELLRRSGDLGRVKRVLALGVPHRGSILAVDNLAGPWDYARDLNRMGTQIAAASLGLISLGTVQVALRSWPSMYELLPDPARTWMTPAEVAKLYDPALWAGIDYPLVPALLADALASWAALPDPPAEVDWVNVCGVGLPTRVGAPTALEMIRHESSVDATAGDGVVPVTSSRLPGRPTLFVPVGHGAMGYDQRLIEAGVDVLLTGMTGERSLPGAVYAAPEATTQGPG